MVVLGAWLSVSPPTRTPIDPGPAVPRAGATCRETSPPERRGIARALRLLGASRDHATPVRILFYGQSITEQGWWLQVVDRLRREYPNAELQIENRAIGGHAADLLLKAAEADVYPFQPDLVIFHAYGSHRAYEALIRRIRERTTADIMVASDHVTLDAELDEDTRPLRLDLRTWLDRIPMLVSASDRLADWNAWINYSFLPALAERHRLQYVGVRDAWKRYLVEHHLPAAGLLRDHVHLNDAGQRLMASIVGGCLEPDPATPEPAPDDDRRLELGPLPLPAAAGRPIRIDFDGTRVDAVLREPPRVQLPVRVDGEPPCALPAAYEFDRPTRYPGTSWPAVLRVRPAGMPLRDETWTVTLHDTARDPRFVVSGSKTGADGEGRLQATFVSPSGRIQIDPEDWDLLYARSVTGQSLPEGFQVHWRSTCRGTDTLVPSMTPEGGPVTLVQGLRNGRHVLQLAPEAAQTVAAIRIYRPPEGRD